MFVVSFDASQIQDAAELAPRLVSARMVEGLRRAADMVVDEAKAHHGYTDRTGALTASIAGEEPAGSARASGAYVDVVADAFYSGYVESGTKPHKIRAKSGSALRFQGRDGRIRFAREVNHPGTKGVRFLEGAMEAKLPEIAALLELEATEAFQSAGFR